jgi:hypothetical protein
MTGLTFVVDGRQIDTEYPRFTIGELVTSKRLGVPGFGIILAIEWAPVYITTKKSPFDRWTFLYPEWKKTWVYILGLEKPQRNQSFQEFMETHDGLETEQMAMFMYDAMTTKAALMAFPEDDLELFDA